jgi:HlyD family secretion protein
MTEPDAAAGSEAAPADKTLDAFLGVKPPSRRARLLKWGAIALGAMLVIGLAAVLLLGRGGKISYATAPVERGNLRVTIAATGNLQPTKQVDVGSELSGLVTQVLVHNNDRVVRGEVLARLDTSRLQDAITKSAAALAATQAGVTQAQATAQLARSSLARFEEVYRLSGGKVPSGVELDTARAQNAGALAAIRTAQAAVAQARAQLSSDQTQFSKATIVSPVNGVVLSRRVEPGQTVAASLNAPVLFQIAEDLSAMQLEAKVDEADVGQVAQGQGASFQVDAFPGRTFPATVQRIDLGANSATASSSAAVSSSGAVVSYTAILSVDNSRLTLRPGMTATAEIVTSQRQSVLLVPNAALRFSPATAASAGQKGGGVTSVLVQRRPGRSGGGARDVLIGRGSRQTVYVLDADGQPKTVQVTIGESDGSRTEVTGPGLQAGARVITGQLSAAAAKAGGGSPSGNRS